SSRFPSPTTKVAGAASRVESTTEPSSSFKVKCKVTAVPGPMMMLLTVNFPFLFGVFCLNKKHIENQQDCTSRNWGIRNIESGPVILPIVPNNNIHYVPQHYAVVEISQRAAQNQGQRQKLQTSTG